VTVDHFDATPLYVQLAAILRRAIETGELQPRKAVPSESYLMGEHGVSRGTVRHALDILRSEGLIQTVPGRGTFVADRK
jgi:DNA-binding GntR family transcriptional regulator